MDKTDEVLKRLISLNKQDVVSKMVFFSELYSLIDEDNSEKILIELLNSEVFESFFIQEKHYKSFKFIEEKLRSKLIKITGFAEISLELVKKDLSATESDLSLENSLFNILKLTLIKTPSKEIENSILNFFSGKSKNIKIINNEIIKQCINKQIAMNPINRELNSSIKQIDVNHSTKEIDTNSSSRQSSNKLCKQTVINPKYLAYIFKISELDEDIIKRISEDSIFQERFLLALYLNDSKTYYEFLNEFLSETYRFTPSLLDSFISVSFDEMPIYNYEVLNYFIKHRPKDEEQILEKCRSIDKNLFLSLVADNFEFFSPFFSDLNVSFNDLVFVSSKNPSVLFYLIESDDFLPFFNTAVFSKALTHTDPEFAEAFFTNFLTKSRSLSRERADIFKELIVAFLRQKNVSEALKRLFSNVFLDCKQYFLSIIQIVDEKVVFKKIPIFLETDEDLNFFLKVVSPNEILLKAHLIKNIEKSLRITALCYKRVDVFNEDVMAQSIILLEKDLPTLVMKTMVVSLLNFPVLKPFMVSYLIKIKNRVWSNPDLLEGFFKCCEVLKEDCLDVLCEFTPLQVQTLSSRKEILDIVKEKLRKTENKKYDNLKKNLIDNKIIF